MCVDRLSWVQAEGGADWDGLAPGHWRTVRQALVAAAAETVKAGRGTTAAATGGPSPRLLAAGVASAVSLVHAAGRRAERLCRSCDRDRDQAGGSPSTANGLAGAGAGAPAGGRAEAGAAVQPADQPARPDSGAEDGGAAAAPALPAQPQVRLAELPPPQAAGARCGCAAVSDAASVTDSLTTWACGAAMLSLGHACRNRACGGQDRRRIVT